VLYGNVESLNCTPETNITKKKGGAFSVKWCFDPSLCP